MTLYQNKYRVETTRLQNWDYASDGWYYITICTKDRENIFGIIEQGIMQLNEHGHIVEQCWFDLPNHYSNLILDAFVVMPDHVHGIMIIDNSRIETGLKPVCTNPNPGVILGDGGGIVSVDGCGVVSGDGCVVETGLKPVSTDTDTSDTLDTDTSDTDTLDMNMNPQPQRQPSKTRHGIFEFVRALKTFSSRRMNELDKTAGKSRWQPRYHDHIIRDEQELHRIQQYIFNNPSAWENDSLK